MANKKSSPQISVETVDDVEPVAEESAPFDIESVPADIRDRIVTLTRRRGPVGGFEQTVRVFLNGAPMPSDADGWAAFANSLER